MYQVIDDPNDEPRKPDGFSIWPFLIGAILAAIVFFFVWLFSPGKPSQAGQTVETPASRATYLKALSEPTPALRRARLLDFKTAYPDSDRIDAITDQIDIIQRAELEEWENLTAKVYDVRADAEAKRTALSEYETRWNRNLMGGRGEELDALATEIDETATAQPLPDRKLEDLESPIPDSLPSDRLAGAPPIYRAPVTIYRPPPVAPPPVARPVIQERVVQPTVRRNVSPRYPRSAQRRKIGAVVVVEMNIDDEGRVAFTDIVSIDAQRYARDFAKAAERAAKRTRFNPKTVNGKAVAAVGVRKRYIFRPSN